MSDSRTALVARADDAGMCRTVNVAIRDACRQGIVRNVSVMVPAPAFAEAAEIFRKMDDIAVGLHLDLTAEWAAPRWGPILPPEEVPTLVDEDGNFFHTPRELAANGATPEHMQAETLAQLQRARDHGLDIAYLDAHMGVGRVNELYVWLRDFCERENLVYNGELFRQGRLRRLPAVEGAADQVERVVKGLEMAEPGVYLLVGHPVYVTDEMETAHLPGQAPGIEARRRDEQRRMLMESAVLNAVRDLNVDLLKYTEVP